ncbi:sigma factor-like helix-turn-helix DNA-binding protein [Streptomyces sp. TP-A0874]|uniref:sigma factor-like helix-turn-helix DNA-binding protein n=1 Tax=Streptomyces sp. TP-A0874 TaxID=549819 RepID=UPI000853AD11|nr:sigma factor-like helix-turn-helix DNA-binding protein [Streptomyces sp. TP-A0874]
MQGRLAARNHHRAREFEAFVAGSGGRLLRVATLLTGDPAAAEGLLVAALADTYAAWDRRAAEDPYAHARERLANRFAGTAWRHRAPGGGLLGGLTARERLVLVLRVYEGVAEEQAAAQLGVAPDRVNAACLRAMAALRSRGGAAS